MHLALGETGYGQEQNIQGVKPKVEQYLNSCGCKVDISGLIAPNLAAGARLAAKNESQALDEQTSRTYELWLITLEQFVAQNGDDANLFTHTHSHSRGTYRC